MKGLIEIDRCQTRAEAELRASALMVAGVQCSLVPIGDAEEGDLLIFTKGDMRGVAGGTNAMTILRVTSQ